MEFDLMDLERSISSAEVSNAIVCYNGLKNQGIEIEQGLIDDLLDLVCFYNSENPREPDLGEDWFSKTEEEMVLNVWKEGGFAEQLFESIENKTPRSYSSIIRGMVKHGQEERALAYYRQATDSGLKLDRKK